MPGTYIILGNWIFCVCVRLESLWNCNCATVCVSLWHCGGSPGHCCGNAPLPHSAQWRLGLERHMGWIDGWMSKWMESWGFDGWMVRRNCWAVALPERRWQNKRRKVGFIPILCKPDLHCCRLAPRFDSMWQTYVTVTVALHYASRFASVALSTWRCGAKLSYPVTLCTVSYDFSWSAHYFVPSLWDGFTMTEAFSDVTLWYKHVFPLAPPVDQWFPCIQLNIGHLTDIYGSLVDHLE